MYKKQPLESSNNNRGAPLEELPLQCEATMTGCGLLVKQLEKRKLTIRYLRLASGAVCRVTLSKSMNSLQATNCLQYIINPEN